MRRPPRQDVCSSIFCRVSQICVGEGRQTRVLVQLLPCVLYETNFPEEIEKNKEMLLEVYLLVTKGH